MYYSEELRDKLQDGYEFEVLDGVYFKHKSKLFRNFIDKLYKIKEESVPGSALYSTSKMLMNSLYGRFGLNPESTRTLIVTPEQSDKIVAKEKNVKIGAVLPSGKVVITYDDKSTDLKKLNISIGIASAIAANSRVVMSGYIRKYSEYLFSIDTDGIKLAVHLDKEEVDPKKLGAMKFEYEFKEGVFPLPKVYGGVLVKPYKKYDKEIVKIKGLKNPVKYDELKKLLNKDYKIRVNEERWFRRIDKRTIFVKDLEIKISTNENKRQFIFNEKDELVDTKPLYLKDGVIESSKAKINTSSLSPPSILPHAVKLLELEKTQKKISSRGGEGARSAERRPLRRL